MNITSEDYGRLLRRCQQLTCDDLRTEELAQDVCLKALQLERDGKIQGSSSVSTLLCGIAGNIHMNNNTKEYGRDVRPGRIRLMAQYVAESKRLHDSSVRRNISEILRPSIDNVLSIA